jgi:hypothetical protein
MLDLYLFKGRNSPVTFRAALTFSALQFRLQIHAVCAHHLQPVLGLVKRSRWRSNDRRAPQPSGLLQGRDPILRS